MLGTKIKFEGVKGVGTVELDLQEDQRVYTLIGTNGVGKTKTLEALFQVLFFTNSSVLESIVGALAVKDWVFESGMDSSKILCLLRAPQAGLLSISNSRDFIEHDGKFLDANLVSIGSFQNRRDGYFRNVQAEIEKGFSSLNMSTNIEQWFVTLAQSSNRFQKGSDNREVEISTVLKLLNVLDNRIDAEYLEIDGDGRVSLKIENQPRELSHLSTVRY